MCSRGPICNQAQIVRRKTRNYWGKIYSSRQVVSGKLRGQRAKSMKFTDGLMIHSGEPRRHYVDTAVRHVHLRQGVLGIKVKIMLPWDPSGKNGPRTPLPDHINNVDPKDEVIPSEPHSENKMEKAAVPVAAPPAPTPELN